ncbi:SAM-dependent methyltransferase [Podospora aff. communis PSN243]|uniref:SAM-dependent methyltransferase n=1 Tax=Podospora aff. communis PSN243 TaxID=3040156 RepID=A0AAV9GSM6_9PEZI|nr:SAM-dependent methyltransferase [Podospora aff. communis PSN243]
MSDPSATASDAHFWDKTAQKYASSPISDQPGYDRTLQKTTSLLTPNSSVLELGCGTGGTAISLARSTANVARFLATDISAGMIDIAKAKTSQAETPALEFRVATAEGLVDEYRGSFNAVVAFNYLHLVRDLGGTLRSVHALLAPGGLFVSKTVCIKGMRFGGVLGTVGIPVMRMVGLAPFCASFDARELRARIEEAGFEVVEVEYHGTKGKDARPFVVARKVG